MRFGARALALSQDGMTLAVGASGESSSASGVNGNELDESSPLSGGVFVFGRASGVWIQEAYIKSPAPDVWDVFGLSLALSADGAMLVVGAINESSQAVDVDGDMFNNSVSFSGAVYVYRRCATAWCFDRYLKAPVSYYGLRFGEVAVSRDGRRLFVGAEGERGRSDAGLYDSYYEGAGAVYVFAADAGSWVFEARLKEPIARTLHRFGQRFAVSSGGDLVVVGVPYEESSARLVNGDMSDESFYQAGAAYVYRRDGGTWQFEAYLKTSVVETVDSRVSFGFGKFVAVSPDGLLIAIGTYDDNVRAGGDAGGHLIPLPRSGAVQVFRRDPVTGWVFEAFLDATVPQQSMEFGSSVSFSEDGRMLAVSAVLEAGAGTGVNPAPAPRGFPQSGAVYLFKRIGSTWERFADLKPLSRKADRSFGASLQFSTDGTELFIGADDDSPVPGVYSNEFGTGLQGAGGVYVFGIQNP